MSFPHFTADQIHPLIAGAIIVAISVFLFNAGSRKTGLAFLFFGSVVFGFFIANLDHFLILWDEQYHALVAKNMLVNPFKPTLYSVPLLQYDYRNWSGNYIWLHKQPLFLWQIALSLKLFGINTLAVRIPSIVMHAVAVLMIYRIGKIADNRNTGFYGALFFALAYYPLELVAGKYATDHNDLAFLFYVTSGFWAWFEYQHSKKSGWVVAVGLFSGCAVLVKWMPGLLIYAVWILTIVIERGPVKWKLKSYLPFFISIAISSLIVIPWQLYIFHVYPLEAGYEFRLNTEHVFHAVENHAGDLWFHFKALKDIYGSGDLIPWLLLLGVVTFITKAGKNTYRVAIGVAIMITYVFYSVVATKMISFCIIVSPFAFLGLGALTDVVFCFLKRKIPNRIFNYIFTSLALLFICFSMLNLSKIQKRHTDWNPRENNGRAESQREMNLIRKLLAQLHDEKYAVFNTALATNGQIPVMFYTNYIAYDIVPNEKQIEEIRKQSYKVAIVDNDNLPAFIYRDEGIIKVKP